jgi:SAM-dependent methyltransferase
VGAGELGVGFENLLNDVTIEVVETDVYFGSRVQVIADAHDLPFADATFEGVVLQAVLEHVADPFRCVGEIHRVLKPKGLVYAETPFMYPVHLGPYDFLRFSLSGHRRLFREFHEIEAGMLSGPGTALAVSIRSLFLSLSTALPARVFARIVLPFLTFWLKWVDYAVLGKPHAADFGSSNYFLGAKVDGALSDREIVDYHWSRRAQPHKSV